MNRFESNKNASPNCDHVKMDRTSADDKLNDNGKELLKLCQSNSLCILNGRIDDIPECRTAQGSSVVDYISASAYLLQFAHNSHINPITPLSDHNSISVNLLVMTSVEIIGKQIKLCV